MSIDVNRFQELLSKFKLKELFIEELGWDRASIGPYEVPIGEEVFHLTTVAQKRGVAVFLCTPDANGEIPNRPVQIKIEKEAKRIVHEHLLIFTDAGNSALTWLWSSRAPGQPVVTRTHTWRKGTSGESLRQKLEAIVWSLEEEEAITLSDVITGLKTAFDRERVTKSFYNRFKSEHEAFADFVEGLANATDKTWYASLMLNRLMFVYFIQRKGFLDGNTNYLADRLQRVRAEAGEGHFHSFYRAFLRRMFHEGLGTPKDQRSAEFNELVGDVPYLNGGLFDPHELEEANPGIDIPDEAFERLFTFFDGYDWHLDDRPLSSGNEINPDVLGYIFEKYINQKQMGAYYTKEDITEYISKNTVIPHLIEQARQRCKVAFEGEESVWNLLKDDPDRYLYEAMKTGVVDENGQIIPESALPDFVQTGMHDAKARMFDKRYNLGEAQFCTATGERGTLPTETWREYVERRGRCLEIREKLAGGEIRSVDDLITLNLDIRQFMQDVIEKSNGPQLLRAIWQAIVGRVPEKSHEKFRHGITILDPTCGSGAFLFAALNILEPLYEACLDRMEGFVEDARKLGRCADKDFVKVLDEVASHPSRSYFVFKSIILHNLFGVDIMPEAVEICKLRLFLKLVSQVNSERELEPLPDIDFNIRTGNTLVGYATEAQFDAIGSGNMEYGEQQDHKAKIKADIADLADLFDRFREQQTIRGGVVTSEDKRKLRDRLDLLSLELDRYLGRDYGIEPQDASDFGAWRESHQPFHWFADFYSVMREGGFDVVIGNPPFVEYKFKNVSYRLSSNQNLATANCGNLYAFITERCFLLCSEPGRFSFIMPSASLCTPRMAPLFDEALARFSFCAISLWDERPSKLFDGVDQQLAIYVCGMSARKVRTLLVSAMRHWVSKERAVLFDTHGYVGISETLREAQVAPKVATSGEVSFLKKLRMKRSTIPPVGATSSLYYKNAGGRYWRLIKSFPTFFYSESGATQTSTEKMRTVNDDEILVYVALYSSTIFYWYWRIVSNCRHLTDREFDAFPIKPHTFSISEKQLLKNLGQEYETDIRKNAVTLITRNRRTGLIKQDSFKLSLSKFVIDKIDLQICTILGCTDEEIDFIINYDIKYRMGGTADET